ncbi:ABC transporter substrate-binding protein [Novosphingobium sp.]|uniref:ABC transporter substrate-binding protein n=1 Tax=Novosphingobium sp. TaxID=1874826 RepID=UPI002734DD57|nr:ABC transporter substrate-binding protein [Novosphingobium sp.]MDP3907853.1 ABC transporter substrate-binding protein [Novosphingobium sp.]
MSRPAPFLRNALIAAILAAMLAACGRGDDRAVEVAVIGDPSAPFATGARLPVAAQLVRAASAEGLVGFDEQGRVIPALADRWIVTDDGLSYIFRLRDGTWPGGGAITGESGRAALVQAIRALNGTALGSDLAVISEVRTMAGRVIELRLRQQVPDLLQLLAQPELGLTMRGNGAGPMSLSRDKRTAILTPIPPQDLGLPQPENWESRRRKLNLVALTAAAAITRFNAGEVDVVLGGRFADFPRLDAASVSRGAIRLDPVTGLFGLAVTRTDGFLGAPENREALAMALDREALAGALNVGGWTATTRVVAPGSADDNGTVAERWPGQSLADRRRTAAARVAGWQDASGKPPALRIALPTGPGGDILLRQLVRDFGAIGLGVRRVGETADADLRLVDTTARYARVGWFLNQLSCANARGPCSANADRLAADALSEPDPIKRAELYAQAEAQLTIANSFIPFGVPVRWSLVSGATTGFAPNRWNIHPLMPLAMHPK